MNMFLKVQIDILSFFLLSMLIFHAFTKLNRKNSLNKFFLTCCILTDILLVSEISSVFLNGSSPIWIDLHKFINSIGFLLAPTIAYLFCRFINLWINKTNIISIRFRYILEIPLFINTILMLINLKFDIIFKIDSMNNYIRGGLFSFGFVISIIYFIYSFVLLSKNRIKVPQELFKFLNIIYLFPLVMSTVQILFPNILFIWSSATISLVLTYIVLQQEMLELDALTGAYNREFFNRNLNKMLFHRTDTYKTGAINIDLNDFKSINDKFGHAEGDIALINVVKLLQEIFMENSFIIRMGGDEFMVILNKTNKTHIETMVNIMIETFDKFNSSSDNGYNLDLSFGYGLFEDLYTSTEVFLADIDLLMYKNKTASKNKEVIVQQLEMDVML